MRLPVRLLLVATLVLGTWAFASPWYSMWCIVNAVEEGDSATLAEWVDFERLRGGMHDDLSASRADGDSDLLDRIGDGIVNTVGGAAIDVAVTPQGLAALLDAATLMPGQDWSWDVDRTGLNTFTAVSTWEDGRAGPQLFFERDGLGWVVVGAQL
ncbi:MAG: DUF2939 domain-containing protein [Alteraurantiacibacter sp.]